MMSSYLMLPRDIITIRKYLLDLQVIELKKINYLHYVHVGRKNLKNKLNRMIV
jgi:hypothetical protein